MALSPAPDDPNREKELKRKEQQPDTFADHRLKRAKDEKELGKK